MKNCAWTKPKLAKCHNRCIQMQSFFGGSVFDGVIHFEMPMVGICKNLVNYAQ